MPSEQISDSSVAEYRQSAKKIRKDIIDMCHAAQSGHPGGSLSAVEYLLWLYNEELDVSPETIDDPGRDRLVYSKGHACPVLYAVLAEYGFVDGDPNEEFRVFGGSLPGHASPKVPGVEFPSGSLGQGLSFANGLAIAADLDDEDYDVYAVLGDGELQEGQIWEAVMTAYSKDLSNLTVIVDRNKKQNDLPVDETKPYSSVPEAFDGFGWNVFECNGHDFEDIAATFAEIHAHDSEKPDVLIADTVKGKGVDFMEAQPNGYHAGGPSDEEREEALEQIEAGLTI